MDKRNGVETAILGDCLQAKTVRGIAMVTGTIGREELQDGNRSYYVFATNPETGGETKRLLLSSSQLSDYWGTQKWKLHRYPKSITPLIDPERVIGEATYDAIMTRLRRGEKGGLFRHEREAGCGGVDAVRRKLRMENAGAEGNELAIAVALEYIGMSFDELARETGFMRLSEEARKNDIRRRMENLSEAQIGVIDSIVSEFESSNEREGKLKEQLDDLKEGIETDFLYSQLESSGE